MVKSLLLGTAAGFVAMAGAQAADLPVKAKPVQYVKICSLYGVGFYYVPGTDMCIKVGGWARYETAYGYNGSLTNEWFQLNTENRSTNDNTWRVKGTATIDARSPTEYGTVRSYIALGLSTSINGGNDPANTLSYDNRWFIQWAGFTIGHSVSFYDFYSVGANQYGFGTAGSDSGDGGWDVFAYTAQFGNGISASLSAEVQRRTRIINGGNFAVLPFTAAAGAVAGANNYEGHDMPDLVANLRADQAWGSAQIMGALHQVAATYYGAVPAEQLGHPGDKLGFAVGAGITLKAPMVGPGDYFSGEVDYTVGASRYTNMLAAPFDYAAYNGGTFGFGYNTDAVYGGTLAAGTASALELTTTWGVNAAFTHNWNTAWKSTLWGSYQANSFDTAANNMICDAGAGFNLGTAAVALAGCDMNWQTWALGLRTQWAISSTFYMGLEVVYAKLESASTPGNLIFLPAVATKPSSAVVGPYAVTDQDMWAVRLRVHRDFYP